LTIPRIHYDDLVVVLVGANEQRFSVHKGILTAKSNFFEAALSARWLDEKEKSVRLPEHTTTAFQSYVRWAYIGEVDLAPMPEKGGPEDMIETCTKTRSEHLDLYLLAHYLQDISLLNKVIEIFVRMFEVASKVGAPLPSADFIMNLYEGTSIGSPLRRVVVDLHSIKLSRANLERCIDEYPPRFIADMAIALQPQNPITIYKPDVTRYFELVENSE
jgi:hypothetical protein